MAEEAAGGRRLREITPPVVVAPPSGARVRTWLKVTGAEAVLMAVGANLGDEEHRNSRGQRAAVPAAQEPNG